MGDEVVSSRNAMIVQIRLSSKYSYHDSSSKEQFQMVTTILPLKAEFNAETSLTVFVAGFSVGLDEEDSIVGSRVG